MLLQSQGVLNVLSETHKAFLRCHCLTPAEGSVYLYMNEDVMAKPIPPPKSSRFKGLWLVFVVSTIVFISTISNVLQNYTISFI